MSGRRASSLVDGLQFWSRDEGGRKKEEENAARPSLPPPPTSSHLPLLPLSRMTNSWQSVGAWRENFVGAVSGLSRTSPLPTKMRRRLRPPTRGSVAPAARKRGPQYVCLMRTEGGGAA